MRKTDGFSLPASKNLNEHELNIYLFIFLLRKAYAIAWQDVNRNRIRQPGIKEMGHGEGPGAGIPPTRAGMAG